ncbi:MAG: uncharacterized protein H6Q59_2024 [Firmicutes bacterium]|nr:uncharacterized protein [Bacillota bacterium]
MKTRKKSIIMIGLVTAIVVMGFGLGFYLKSPINMVTIDINPSLELHTNTLGYVVSVDPVNEDAVQLMAGYKLVNRDLESVIENIVDRMILNGYLIAGQKNQILISAEGSISANKLLGKVKKNISNYAQSKQLMVEVLHQSIDINEAEVELAHEYNISVGKMAFIDKLAESSNSLPLDELAKTSVKDLIQFSVDQNIPLEDMIQNYSEVIDNQPVEVEVVNDKNNPMDALSSATMNADAETVINVRNLSENDGAVVGSDKYFVDNAVETDAVSSATIKKDTDKLVISSDKTQKIAKKSDKVDAVSSATIKKDSDVKGNVSEKVKVEKKSDYEKEDNDSEDREDYGYEDNKGNDSEDREDYDYEDNKGNDSEDREDYDYEDNEDNDSEDREDYYYEDNEDNDSEDREDYNDEYNEDDNHQEKNHYEDNED